MPPDVLEPELVGDPMAAHASRLALLRRWAVLLDSAFAIPGTPVRFGLDAIVGLVPGIGDLTTPAFTVLLLGTGLRMRVPAVVLARMVMNAGVDALIGLVPIAGDLVDLGWSATSSTTLPPDRACSTTSCGRSTRAPSRCPTSSAPA